MLTDKIIVRFDEGDAPYDAHVLVEELEAAGFEVVTVEFVPLRWKQTLENTAMLPAGQITGSPGSDPKYPTIMPNALVISFCTFRFQDCT